MVDVPHVLTAEPLSHAALFSAIRVPTVDVSAGSGYVVLVAGPPLHPIISAILDTPTTVGGCIAVAPGTRNAQAIGNDICVGVSVSIAA